MSAPSFLIVDDHPLFHEALQSALEVSYPGAQIEVAESVSAAQAILGAKIFNLVLLDLKMPDTHGLEGLELVRAQCPKTPVAVISAMSGPDVVNKVKTCGADGFIYKSQRRQDILGCVARILNGARSFPDFSTNPHISPGSRGEDLLDRLQQLTPQQLKVLRRVCEAKLNKQIAFELGVTETTVKAHITLIFKKLGVHSRTQAVLLLQKMRTELEDTEFAVLLSAQA